MNILVLLLLLIYLLLAPGNSLFAQSETEQQAIKQAALQVLEQKCNTCHIEEYKRRVFTRYNMSDNAKRIYKQVFKKEKMPKDPITLREKERAALKRWLQLEGEWEEN